MRSSSHAAPVVFLLIALPIAAATSCDTSSHYQPPPHPLAGSSGAGGSGGVGGATGTPVSSTSASGAGGMSASTSASGAGGMGSGMTGDPCTSGQDCMSGVCEGKKCSAPSCGDKVQNGDETDMDCGGSCPPCSPGKHCGVPKDCDTGVCTMGVCQIGLCGDKIQNGSETDVDCGGGMCPACDPGLKCSVGTDCTSGVCSQGICQAPSCNDKVLNGSETDLDCGGLACPPCVSGLKCGVPTDCKSKVCTQSICQAPSCNDGVQNGTESDVDCSGGCTLCGIGYKCTNNGDCASNTCQGGICVCPQGMTIVPIAGGNSTKYCIDSVEVTYAQYTKFYNASPNFGNQPAYCLWNQSYTPTGNWPFPPNHANYPVTDVDWCDADAYCRYSGKHLCGKIGGGANLPADHADKTKSEWFNACTAQGINSYPYGNVPQSVACRGVDMLMAGKPAGTCNVAGSCLGTLSEDDPLLASCQGGEPGLYQMSGDVAEWENSCDGSVDQNDNCLIRGGSHCDTVSSLACSSGAVGVSRSRNYKGCDVGFRCCL